MNGTDVLAGGNALAEPSIIVPRQGALARPRWKRLLMVLSLLLGGLALVIALGVGYLVARGGWYRSLQTLPAADGTQLDIKPEGVYVFVDTHKNRLRVYENGKMLREAICSTGSGMVLRDPRDDKVWTFDSPLGEQIVRRKVKDPIWYKPDWAFIEEGQIPPKSREARMDDFSLGKYGLYMDDGYIIHGTIFQTLLGQSLTHGCIRLGDDDLEFVYKTVPVGARVYIY
jgi:lipoprotein-anchoring transpeptidase ErfK/SrfK